MATDTTKYGFPANMPEVHRLEYLEMSERISKIEASGMNKDRLEQEKNARHLLLRLYYENLI